MTIPREEVARKVAYCNEMGIPFKYRVEELGYSIWDFYRSRRKYAQQQKQEAQNGEFVQLITGESGLIPESSFASTIKRSPKKSEFTNISSNLTVDLRTPAGTVIRIQGEINDSLLESIIKASGANV